VWSTPRRELVVERSGRVRLGWASVAFVAATGLPDAEAGDAQALNRVTLRLMQAWGTTADRRRTPPAPPRLGQRRRREPTSMINLAGNVQVALKPASNLGVA
jgi:hypothetical protein